MGGSRAKLREKYVKIQMRKRIRKGMSFDQSRSEMMAIRAEANRKFGD